MNLSPQQSKIMEWTTQKIGSVFVQARAGTGKTTTLIEMLVRTQGSVAFCAFNKKIVVEIEAKIADKANPLSKNHDPRFIGLGNRVRIGTFHSFGFSAWRFIHKGVKVDARAKDKRLALDMGIPEAVQGFVLKLVSLAKQRAIGLFGALEDRSLWYDIVDHFDLANEIENPDEIDAAVSLAIITLRHSQKISNELIDFDDMIYMPVVTGCRMWENDWVLVDEAQDTNPARRALARKMLKKNGRAAFVGDDCQAIYGFTGADSDAIDQIVRDFNCTTLPLTTTYRCPKSVVSLAQTIVPDIEAHASAPEGSVDSVESLSAVTDLSAADAILCRNTKPLVQTAYTLIRKGIPCHVEGKDIGIGLLKLVNKYAARTLDGLRNRLESFMDTETAKLVAKGRETMAEALADRIETVFVLMDGCQDVDCLRSKIATMFLDSDNEAKPTLTLSTIHKSKGREWERVFVINRELMPSKFARQAWQQVQERNIEYVCYTRAKQTLIFVEAA